jgi:hypothetical protein
VRRGCVKRLVVAVDPAYEHSVPRVGRCRHGHASHVRQGRPAMHACRLCVNGQMAFESINQCESHGSCRTRSWNACPWVGKASPWSGLSLLNSKLSGLKVGRCTTTHPACLSTTLLQGTVIHLYTSLAGFLVWCTVCPLCSVLPLDAHRSGNFRPSSVSPLAVPLIPPKVETLPPSRRPTVVPHRP